MQGNQPTISNFINAFKKDLARPCNFSVKIYPSENVNNTLSLKLGEKIKELYDGDESFEFKCEAAEFPSRQFGLVDLNIYGPSIKFPISNSYYDIILRFICSDDMKEKMFFDGWLDLISLPSKTKFIGKVGETSETNSLETYTFGSNYDFSYKSNYIAKVIVKQYDLKGDFVYGVALENAFPYVVRALPLRWHEKDDYHKVDVHFNYRYFKYVKDNEVDDKGILKKFLKI